MTALHVVLVHPEIHWNTGNVGRTCLATGAQLHLVRPLGFSLADRQLKRAGLDYWADVDPRVWDDWETFADALPGLGEPLLFSAEGAGELWESSLTGDRVLIFGSESRGLPQRLRERYASALVRIPQVESRVRSLNLSTSVAVAVYEALRQRGAAQASGS